MWEGREVCGKVGRSVSIECVRCEDVSMLG